MIARLTARFLEPSGEFQEEVTTFLATYGDPQRAWIVARGRRQAAESIAQWSADDEVRHRSRYWGRVMREIERQSGYQHQPDTASAA